VKVQLAQQRIDRELLVGRQRLISQPAAALDAEQVRRGAARREIALQDRLHLILRASALADDMRAA
jgi:hypothetical protein